MNLRSRPRAAILALAALALAGCPTVHDPELLPAGSPPAPHKDALPLKVHLLTGDVLLLDQWREWPGDSGVIGTGTRFDVRRAPVGPFDGPVPRDSIALLEMSRSHSTAPVGSILLATWTVLSTTVAAVCLSDPKACFGSCPTFYLREDDPRPVAEGFSASVARTLEATDVDDLGPMNLTGHRFNLTMRNEALETHAVRSLRLLVAPRPRGGTLIRTVDGAWFVADEAAAPVACVSASGDCVPALRARDGDEWHTRVDSTDLGARDSLVLVFPSGTGPRALLVASRQSLASTFVFYQALAWAGSRAGEVLAEVERRGTAAFPGAWTMMRHLTEVEVLAGPAGAPLVPVGLMGEAGPLATDQYALRLPDAPADLPLQVRLRFARGAWRFDRIVAVRVAPTQEPRALEPFGVMRAGLVDTVALGRLRDPDRYLITQPGDAYRVSFALPDDASRLSFFLEARGYYYEWMRQEWLAEEDPEMHGLVAASPDQALRRMAAGYARIEPRLEEMFWASRFARR